VACSTRTLKPKDSEICDVALRGVTARTFAGDVCVPLADDIWSVLTALSEIRSGGCGG